MVGVRSVSQGQKRHLLVDLVLRFESVAPVSTKSNCQETCAEIANTDRRSKAVLTLVESERISGTGWHDR